MGLSEIVSFLLGILTELAAKPLFYGVGGRIMMLFVDVPNVAGAWRTTYEEPVTGESAVVTASEDLELHQFGRLVWGTGTISDTSSRRQFHYRGHITRNVLLAQYATTTRTMSVGSGAVQTKINDRCDVMTGWCFWHDKDSERIEASRYSARRVGAAAA
jgi:hypothetical protein